MQKYIFILCYIVISIFVLGLIFITPDIFVSINYTFQYFWELGNLIIISIVFLCLKKKILVTTNSLIPIVLSLTFLFIYLQGEVIGLMELLLMFAVLSLLIDNIKIERQNISVFYNILAVLCCLQALYGLGQYFSLLPKFANFPITGTFDNPAGFVACISMLYPFVLHKDGVVSRQVCIWKGGLALLCILTIALSESRTGILTVLVITVIWLYRDTKLLSFFKNYRLQTRVLVILSILAVVVSLLYVFKLNSANGRLLIWRVALSLINESPFLGHGPGGFWANYMNAQADYFVKYPDSHFILLADNVKYAFNEYIHLLVEYGFLGLLIMCCYVTHIFIAYRKHPDDFKTPVLYSIIALLIMSLFSYPMAYPFVWILTGLFLAILAYRKSPIFYMPKIIRLLGVFMIIFFVLLPLIQKYRDERKWFEISQLSLAGKTKDVIYDYKELYTRMNGDGLFMYNYGAELAYVNKYEESRQILEECALIFNDMDVQILLADNYKQLRCFDKAERCLLLAHNMCPNRFIPLYQLVKLYIEQGNENDALLIANKILKMKVKIPSNAINRIRREMKDYVEKKM